QGAAPACAGTQHPVHDAREAARGAARPRSADGPRPRARRAHPRHDPRLRRDRAALPRRLPLRHPAQRRAEPLPVLRLPPGRDVPPGRDPGTAGLGARRRGLRRARGGHLDERARPRRRLRRRSRARPALHPAHLRSARDPPGHLAHEGTARMTTDSRTASARAAAATPGAEPTADPTGPIPVLPGGAPRLDIAQVSEALLGRWADTRRAARDRAARPELHRPSDATVAEPRERVFQQLQILVEDDVSHPMLPEHLGGPNDNGANVAGFEELVVADPSLQIKAGVQWGLYTSAIIQLGDQEQQRAGVPAAMSLETAGAFAMTEIGHGSDVQSLATTATFDPEGGEDGEWVIHTPFRAAWKEFLGNAAIHAKAATVFARLITNGVDHGVHCFYVPVRDADGELLPGVSSEDDGEKGGLNGIDNGRLAFDHVRVPRTNLLGRYGDVAPDGTYTSPIESPGRRFFTMLGTLVPARVSLDGSAIRASQLALHIAITYATQRRQFSAADPTQETVLMDYQSHLHRLLPKLAATYAGAFAHEQLLQA